MNINAWEDFALTEKGTGKDLMAFDKISKIQRLNWDLEKF